MVKRVVFSIYFIMAVIELLEVIVLLYNQAPGLIIAIQVIKVAAYFTIAGLFFPTRLQEQ